jgi:dihydroorotate dehydrogenase electron transfer subunit
MAIDPYDVQSALATPLFAIENVMHGFWASPLQQVTWGPGTDLELVGPLGHGFDLPGDIQRLGLVALGETVSRLMPLARKAVENSAGVALFTDLPLPRLPAAVEIHPLESIIEALDWPDYLALDVPLERMEGLRRALGILDAAPMPCPVRVLVSTPMPCAGLAQCGACAIRGRRAWKLVCADGPVFDLQSLSW